MAKACHGSAISASPAAPAGGRPPRRQAVDKPHKNHLMVCTSCGRAVDGPCTMGFLRWFAAISAISAVFAKKPPPQGIFSAVLGLPFVTPLSWRDATLAASARFFRWLAVLFPCGSFRATLWPPPGAVFFLLHWWSQRPPRGCAGIRLLDAAPSPWSSRAPLRPWRTKAWHRPMRPVDKAGSKPVHRPVETVPFCGQAPDCPANRVRQRYAAPSPPWAATRQSMKAWAARLGWGDSRHIATNWQS